MPYPPPTFLAISQKIGLEILGFGAKISLSWRSSQQGIKDSSWTQEAWGWGAVGSQWAG